MPLLVYAANMWYGSAQGTAVDTAPTIDVDADIRGTLTGAVDVTGGDIAPYLKGTMGRKQTLSVEAIGELEQANWKKRGRVALDVSIGAVPSAYDIAQAVWGQVASAVNNAGTTGEKLNGAGSAGNPWIDTSDYPAGSKGALLKQAADDAELASIK